MNNPEHLKHVIRHSLFGVYSVRLVLYPTSHTVFLDFLLTTVIIQRLYSTYTDGGFSWACGYPKHKTAEEWEFAYGEQWWCGVNARQSIHSVLFLARTCKGAKSYRMKPSSWRTNKHYRFTYADTQIHLINDRLGLFSCSTPQNKCFVIHKYPVESSRAWRPLYNI